MIKENRGAREDKRSLRRAPRAYTQGEGTNIFTRLSLFNDTFRTFDMNETSMLQ